MTTAAHTHLVKDATLVPDREGGWWVITCECGLFTAQHRRLDIAIDVYGHHLVQVGISWADQSKGIADDLGNSRNRMGMRRFWRGPTNNSRDRMAAVPRTTGRRPAPRHLEQWGQ